ncbi:hypothetical protein [Solwaraspora sp. WMMA2101]|uniref:hypothetical protein n=1 Tax=Solwaraspora sp. WMMA2101 TaxID=3404124 RepID=UPI003B92C8B3
MSDSAVFLGVVAISAAATAVAGALIWVMVAAQRRAEESEIDALRADLLREAGRSGWVESDPPAELTWRGLATVIPDEKRRCALVGTHDGHQVALIWCDYQHDEVSLRYVALLVGLDQLDEPLPAMGISFRSGRFPPRRPAVSLPDDDAQFLRRFTVLPHDDPDAVGRALTGPVRSALYQLRDLRGWADRPIRIEGRALQVVVDGWPRLAGLGARLSAATTLAAALSTTATATDDGSDT